MLEPLLSLEGSEPGERDSPTQLGLESRTLPSARPQFESPPPCCGCMQLPQVSHLSEVVSSCANWGQGQVLCGAAEVGPFGL